MTTKTRLKAAKRAIAPPEVKTYQVVYKQDDRYWITTDKNDHRQCIGGGSGERDITKAELDELGLVGALHEIATSVRRRTEIRAVPAAGSLLGGSA